MVVTFCPGCGDLRPEAALRSCARCQLDLRSLLSEGASIWEPLPPAPPAPALPPPTPAALPPAGVCGICGGSFPAFWRTVVAIPGGSRELLVCGRRPTCATDSLVPPTLV